MRVKRVRVWALLPVAVAALAAATAGPAVAANTPAGGGKGTFATVHGAESVTASHPVVLVGIPGLRWSDVSQAGTPELWRLAGAGSVGSLVVHTISTVTCPGDGWLTLNAGTRAT